MKNIGENIKLYRKLRNYDQKALADVLDVSDKTISSWECGRTEPKMGMIEKLADALSISKAHLIGIESPKIDYVMEVDKGPGYHRPKFVVEVQPNKEKMQDATLERLVTYFELIQNKDKEALLDYAAFLASKNKGGLT